MAGPGGADKFGSKTLQQMSALMMSWDTAAGVQTMELTSLSTQQVDLAKKLKALHDHPQAEMIVGTLLHILAGSATHPTLENGSHAIVDSSEPQAEDMFALLTSMAKQGTESNGESVRNGRKPERSFDGGRGDSSWKMGSCGALV
jgi:hypothetical protein